MAEFEVSVSSHSSGSVSFCSIPPHSFPHTRCCYFSLHLFPQRRFVPAFTWSPPPQAGPLHALREVPPLPLESGIFGGILPNRGAHDPPLPTTGGKGRQAGAHSPRREGARDLLGGTAPHPSVHSALRERLMSSPEDCRGDDYVSADYSSPSAGPRRADREDSRMLHSS